MLDDAVAKHLPLLIHFAQFVKIIGVSLLFELSFICLLCHLFSFHPVYCFCFDQLEFLLLLFGMVILLQLFQSLRVFYSQLILFFVQITYSLLVAFYFSFLQSLKI